MLPGWSSGARGEVVGRQRERAVLERLLDTARERSRRRPRRARRPRRRQDRAARVRGRGGRFPRRSDCRRRGGDEARLRGAATALFADPRVQRASPIPSVTLGVASASAPDRRRVRSCRARGSRPSPKLPSSSRCCARGRRRAVARRRSARALAFVARRLLAERIALAFATRDVGSGLARFPSSASIRWAVGMPGAVGVRPRGAARRVRARADRRGDRRESACAPGTPARLTPAQLAGGFGLPAALPLSTGIEQSFTRRLARLPRDTRRLLLLAAAEPVGDLALLWRAAQQLGIPETAARAVEAEGLLTLDGAVVFRHPLVRSAGVRCGRAERAARGSPRAGGRNRSAARPGSPRVAPRAGGVRAGRRAGRRTRALGGRAQARAGSPLPRLSLRAPTLTREPSRRARGLAAAQTKFRRCAR